MQKRSISLSGYQVNSVLGEFHETKGRDFLIFHGYGANFDDLLGLVAFLQTSDFDRFYFPNAPIPLSVGIPGFAGRAWFNLDYPLMEKCARSGDRALLRNYLDSGVKESSQGLRQLVLALGLRPKKTIFAGFSQGAMIAEELAWSFPNFLRGLCLFSTGLDRPNAIAEGLLANTQLKVFQSHGKNDQVLPYFVAEMIADVYRTHIKQAENFQFYTFDGGHEIPPAVLDACRKFM